MKSLNRKLVELIFDHSLQIKPQDKLLVDYQENGKGIVEAIEEISRLRNISLNRFFRPKIMDISYLTQLNTRLDECSAYLHIGGDLCELSCNDDRQEFEKISGDIMLKKYKLKWVSTRFPSESLARDLNISLAQLRKIYFASCFVDMNDQRRIQEKISTQIKPGEIRIISQEGDIKLQLCGKPHYCDGRVNIPDGEVFWEVDPSSTEGKISFSIPFRYGNSKFKRISLKFKEGKVIESDSDNSTDLNHLLNLDQGAKYLGEFGIGTNPRAQVLGDSFYDEKVLGTFHLGLGAMSTRLESKLHLDIVKKLSEVEIYNNQKRIILI